MPFKLKYALTCPGLVESAFALSEPNPVPNIPGYCGTAVQYGGLFALAHTTDRISFGSRALMAEAMCLHDYGDAFNTDSW